MTNESVGAGQVDALAALAERVAALEDRLDGDRAASTVEVPDEDRFWALRGLKRRLGADGGVLLTGSVRRPDGEVAAEWQQAATTHTLLESDWSEVADPLAALGHPVRLEVLRAVLNGTTTTTALAELDGIGTRGQLHHHLRGLTSSGWLQSVGRGDYQVPAPRTIPLLAIITGARR